MIKEWQSRYLNCLIYIFRMRMTRLVYMLHLPARRWDATAVYICGNIYRRSHKKNPRISFSQDDLDPLFASRHRTRTPIYFPRSKCDDMNVCYHGISLKNNSLVCKKNSKVICDIPIYSNIESSFYAWCTSHHETVIIRTVRGPNEIEKRKIKKKNYGASARARNDQVGDVYRGITTSDN